MPRQRLIAANWKMYKNPDQTREFFQAFLPLVADHTRDEIVVCPPYTDLHAAVEATTGSNVAIGAQDMYWKEEGAFTGEISPGMLLAAECTHVIIGHSERRQYFGETDDTVNLKLKAALEAGLTPIVCVGEVLEEREAVAKFLKNVKPTSLRTSSAGNACAPSMPSPRRRRAGWSSLMNRSGRSEPARRRRRSLPLKLTASFEQKPPKLSVTAWPRA